MGRRLLPALLVVLAALADGRGAHGLAFYALLGAVPFAAVAAIAAFGEQLDSRGDAVAAMQALLWGLVVVLLVVSCSARSGAPVHVAVPRSSVAKASSRACMRTTAMHWPGEGSLCTSLAKPAWARRG